MWHAAAVLQRAAVAGLLGLGFGLLAALPPGALAAPLDDWRNEATRIRQLAENDVPRALAEARRLRAALPEEATPADRVRALNVLGRAATYMGLTEEAAALAREAFALASQHGDRVGQAEADLNTSLNAINQGRLDELVAATQRSVVSLEGVDRPELLAEAMLRLAVMYRRFEQFDECVAVASQTMEIARRSQHPLALTYAHQAMAMAFGQSNDEQRSHDHHAQVREMARRVPLRMIEAFSIAGMAGHRLKLGQPEQAEQLAREALALHREVGAPFAIAFGLYGLADVLSATGRRRQALPLRDESVAIFERYPNRIGQWFALNARSADHLALGDTQSAREDAQRAYRLAQELGHAIYLSGSARKLAAIAAAAGDYRRAYELGLEASEMTAKAARDKSGARMLQLTQRYETESKQRAIDALTRQTEQQQAQLQQRTLQQRWQWTLLAAVLLALGGAVLHVRRTRAAHRELQRLNRQLQASENAVRGLNADLEQRVQDRTAALRQQARYLRTLIDMLPMWAWFKDTRSRYLVTNRAHAQALGHEVDQMLGRSDAELEPAEAARQSLAADAEVMASGERKTLELPIEGPQGTQWMEVYQAPVNDEDGSLLGTVGVARDISLHKAAEQAREASLAEAERLARLRSEFLAQMSHELRTPLNGILGFAELLLDDPGLSERQRRALGIVQHSGQHLLDLINDLLDMSRIDAGRLELHATPVRLADCVRGVADIVTVKAEQKGLQFTVDLPAELPPAVMVDDLRLRQVLLNLASNAVKFCDRGRVTLRLRPLAGAGEGSGSVRLAFEVEDTGIGMSTAQLAKLFQPFEQVADNPRRQGGAGLGLAISRQLVRLMGGDIQVESVPGQGSRFWFELLLARAESLPAAPAEPVPLAASTAADDSDTESSQACHDQADGPIEAAAAAAPPATVQAPPLAELRALDQLARAGDMRQLSAQAQRLHQADPRWAAFAAQVRALAGEFRSQAVSAFVQEHLAKAQSPAPAAPPATPPAGPRPCTAGSPGDP